MEKKPENGGTPDSASPPITKQPNVNGIARAEAAHPVERLLARHRADDRARAHEQQRLEEGVRHQVEHARRVGADGDAHDHVADLRHRRVGDHALDVGLHERDRAPPSAASRSRSPRPRPAPPGRSSNSGCMRAIRYTPAVTIVAAWISALTGVGPSIASGSHVCSGICADFANAPDEQQHAARRRGPLVAARAERARFGRGERLAGSRACRCA